MFDVCLIVDNGTKWEMQWSYLLSHFIPRNIYFIYGDRMDMKVKPFQNAICINDATELPDLPLVLLAPETGHYYIGNESLIDFEHPNECIYMFGSDHTHLSDDEMSTRDPDNLVYIPTDTKDQMFSWLAGGITFYDRKVKNG